MIGSFVNFRIFFVVLAASATICSSQLAFALGTSRESQIGGFIHASLKTIIVGELAGRKQSQSYPTSQVPVCRPSDFADLPAAASDDVAFDAFYRRCRFVEVKVNDTHVVGTAYLPAGYCETVKQAYDRMLAVHVYAVNAQVKENREGRVEGNLAGVRIQRFALYELQRSSLGEARAAANEM